MSGDKMETKLQTCPDCGAQGEVKVGMKLEGCGRKRPLPSEVEVKRDAPHGYWEGTSVPRSAPAENIGDIAHRVAPSMFSEEDSRALKSDTVPTIEQIAFSSGVAKALSGEPRILGGVESTVPTEAAKPQEWHNPNPPTNAQTFTVFDVVDGQVVACQCGPPCPKTCKCFCHDEAEADKPLDSEQKLKVWKSKFTILADWKIQVSAHCDYKAQVTTHPDEPKGVFFPWPENGIPEPEDFMFHEMLHCAIRALTRLPQDQEYDAEETLIRDICKIYREKGVNHD